MSSQPKTFYTPEQYLEFELNTEQRNEYFQAEIFGMAGAKTPQVVLAGNFLHHLKLQLDERCQVFQSDLRVHVRALPNDRLPSGIRSGLAGPHARRRIFAGTGGSVGVTRGIEAH